MEMDLMTLGIFVFVAIGISLYIMYEIIKAGSYGKKIYIEQLKQTKLLIEVAKKKEVHQGTINEIIEPEQYKNV